jgi:hypothetical protein
MGEAKTERIAQGQSSKKKTKPNKRRFFGCLNQKNAKKYYKIETDYSFQLFHKAYG